MEVSMLIVQCSLVDGERTACGSAARQL
jgi:hypothetical protein